MLGKTKPALLVLALVMAFFTAWAAHAVAQAPDAPSVTCERVEPMQQNAGVDHFHASQLGDHHHDVPHLIAALLFASPAEKSPELDAAQYPVPSSPIFLIKRPPRAWLLT